jgi:hypothetical protein
MTENRALITRPGANLGVALYSPVEEARKLGKLSAQHCLQSGTQGEHAVLCATAKDRAEAHFVSVLSPTGPKGTPPRVIGAAGTGWLGVRLAGGGQAAFRTGGSEAIGTSQVATDGFALYWLPGRDGRPAHVLAMGARRLWLNGQAVWSSPAHRSILYHPTTPA